jgi:hypothetical protein
MEISIAVDSCGSAPVNDGEVSNLGRYLKWTVRINVMYPHR